MVLRSVITILCACLLLQTVSAQNADELPLQVKRWLAAGDFAQAIPWLIQASNEGNAVAAFTLGKHYRLGKGGSKDLKKSADYLLIAAQADIAQAQYLLALQLDKEGRREAAQEWFKKASALGHAASKKFIAQVPEAKNVFELIDRETPDASRASGIEWTAINSQGETTLIHAVRGGKAQWVEFLAGRLAESQLGLRDKLGNTALHYAAQAENAGLLEPLLEAGADPDNKNVHGSTPLHLAVAAGDVRAARVLLEYGAKADRLDNNGWSPSMLAERSGSNAMSFVAKLGPRARPSVRDKNVDVSAELFRAVRLGDRTLLKELLRSGADVNISNGSGVTLLSTAIERGNRDVVAALLKSGARRDLQNGKGQSPLVQAIRRSDADIAGELISAGADIEVADARGWWPLHHAVMSECSTCVDMLLVHGADATMRTRKDDTALILAARNGQEAIAQRLTLVDSTLELVDAKGRSPLWWAVAEQLPQLASALILAGAKLNADAEGVGPLHRVVESDDTKLFDLVLNGSAAEDMQLQSRTGSTPLLLAAYHDNAYAVQRLLERGVEIDQQNSSGATALIVAVGQHNLASATILLQAGASLNRRDQQNNSARSLMEKIDDEAWSQLLDNAPSDLESLFGRLTSR